MRRFFRWLGRLTGALFLLVVLFLGAAALGGLIPGRSADLPDGDAVEIGLLYGPIHVDFLLPATPETRAALGFAEAAGVPVQHPDVGYIVVGWGARDFYTQTPTWADLSFGATLRAFTGDASVLRMDVLPHAIAFDTVPRLSLSQAQYAALLAEIAATTAGPAPRALEVQGYGPTSGFIEAQGRFNIFRTCNTWINRTMRAAGVEAGAWTPTPYALRLALWRAGRVS